MAFCIDKNLGRGLNCGGNSVVRVTNASFFSTISKQIYGGLSYSVLNFKLLYLLYFLLKNLTKTFTVFLQSLQKNKRKKYKNRRTKIFLQDCILGIIKR